MKTYFGLRLIRMLSFACFLATGCHGAEEIGRFWNDTLAQLHREPAHYVVEVVNEPLPYLKYKVTFSSWDGAQICGYLALPIAGERTEAVRWPAIICAPGYGGTQQSVMLSECMRGYAILQIFPRGQGDSSELSPLHGREKLTAGIEQPKGYYYQGAYADMVRGVDYLATRPEVDADRIAIMGTSQGGGIALAVAAIDPRIKVVVAHLPFLCDMRQAASTPHSLVKTLLDKARRNDEAALRTLDYFDPYQLASLIKVPVLISSGGKDETCPAVTIRAVYDRLSGIKSIAHYPALAHTSCSDFYQQGWTWLALYLKPRTEP